jgi:tetratricopeptide (TPR) repeat protein
MDDDGRLDGLRRRVHKDPASIAFAQLAEEHRRNGRLDEAVRVSIEGLAFHPDYPSPRVTLARALAALGRLDEAQQEFKRVLQIAPGNLAAARGLDDLHRQRSGTRPAEGVDVVRSRRVIAVLERWLSAIHVARTQRRA